MFSWKKGELTDEQELAIKEKENVLLVACPGSGKTRTLTYKIAYELSLLTNPKEFIIALTYTNNAADEIKERIELLGVDTNQLWIGTIHSFCMEWILKPYSLYIDELKYGFRIINSHESEEMITDLCKNTGVTFWDFGLSANIDGIKTNCTNSSKLRKIKGIIEKYYSKLNDNSQIDFEQIIFFSYKLLDENPFISSILSKIIPLVLIDEFQDTKEIQYHIVLKIIKGSNQQTKSFIVGDPNQAIFSSLGGYPMGKEELELLFNCSFVKLTLTGNYRSSKKIIEYFNFYATYNETILGVGENKNHASNITYNTTTDKLQLTNEITRLIEYNVKTLNIPPNEICIVAPQWIHLASITRNLVVKLPDYSFDGPGMVPFSRDNENFWFKLSKIVLTEPSPTMYIKRLRWSKEVLRDLELASVDITKITNKSFLKLCNSIQITEDKGLKYLEAFFNKILKELSIDLKLFPMLLEHYKSFFESSYKRIEKLKSDYKLDYIDSVESFRKVFKEKEGITVSTIHGVKGEEYDVVIGFGLLEGYIPHFAEKDKLNGAKRLLYVLSSRAKKNLHLISETGRMDFFGNEYEPTNVLYNYLYEYD